MAELRDQLQEALGTAYTVERELGGGGMSRVFVAHDNALQRDLVVKILPPELVAGVNVERFRREILVAAGLQHPHIVPVLNAGDMDGLPWFTMPFVSGESLRQRLTRGPLPIPETIGILRDVAKALAYAHERNVVHRDIKPDNVLLAGHSAVVTDFGIAKALSASRSDGAADTPGGTLTQVGMSIGTPMYMAPEQAAADPNADARADLYAFGCMAYELLAGHPPFAGMSPQRLLAAHMAERPRNVIELRPDTPPALAELVMRCLEKNPNERPQSAADVLVLLDSAATTSGATAAAHPALIGRAVSVRVAVALWAAMFGAAWILAKAAIVGIGLPSWVLPATLIVAALGLPAILVTAFIQRTARRVLTRTPTLTPGGTIAPQGTMATIALKASPHVSWRRTTRGGVAAFTTLIVAVGVFMTLRALGIGPAGSLLASGQLSSREPLLVADFAVKQGDTTLGAVVAEAMRVSLSQSSSITLVTPQAVAAALQRMQKPTNARLDGALAREMAQREGIRAVVDGDIATLGSGYVVSARLVNAVSGERLASAQKVADGPKELIDAVGAIGRELRGKIGESLRSVQSSPPLGRVSTASIEALRKYAEGVHAYTVDGDQPTAIARLREAVELDTGFAMAWRKLGAVYSNIGLGAGSDSAFEHAYRLRDRLTAEEQRITIASYFTFGPGHDRARGEAALKEAVAAGDTDVAAGNYALLLEARRQYAAAESLDAAWVGHQRNSSQALVNLMAVQASAGEADKVRRTADDLLKRFPSPVQRGGTFAMLGLTEFAFGNVEYSEHLFDSLAAAAPPAPRLNAVAAQGALASLHGRFNGASQKFTAADGMSRSAGFPPVALQVPLLLAQLDIMSFDRPAQAVARIDSALAATPFRALAIGDRRYLDVATLYAQAGRADKAKAVLAQRAADVRDSARLRAEEPPLHIVLGEIAMAEGRPRDAVHEFWRGDSLPDGPVDECDQCTYLRLARTYDKAALPDSAVAYFEKYFGSTMFNRLFSTDAYARAPSARRLGELYEAKGNRSKAAHYYQMFVDLWKNADPPLQPQVADVRKRLARLGDLEKR